MSDHLITQVIDAIERRKIDFALESLLKPKVASPPIRFSPARLQKQPSGPVALLFCPTSLGKEPP
jgi:hypothetical protein